jgi:hypothetical protein
LAASDANWAWKVDVAASSDGKTYKDVPDLQNIDLHGKWEKPSCAPRRRLPRVFCVSATTTAARM